MSFPGQLVPNCLSHHHGTCTVIICSVRSYDRDPEILVSHESALLTLCTPQITFTRDGGLPWMCLYTCTDPKTLHGLPLKFSMYAFVHPAIDAVSTATTLTMHSGWILQPLCMVSVVAVETALITKCMKAYVENLPCAVVEDSIEITLLWHGWVAQAQLQLQFQQITVIFLVTRHTYLKSFSITQHSYWRILENTGDYWLAPTQWEHCWWLMRYRFTDVWGSTQEHWQTNYVLQPRTLHRPHTNTLKIQHLWLNFVWNGSSNMDVCVCTMYCGGRRSP